VLQGRPPTVEDRVRLPYTEQVILEAMRLYPPAWAIGREAVADVRIGPYTVKKGTVVLMSQWLMHHDPRYFDDPWSFRPERWERDLAKRLPKYAYFPFGGGPRICIGNMFAQMEAVLLLATLAQRFRLSLDSGQQLRLQPGITLRPANGIHMTLHARDRALARSA
jgi:cytochrome P450